MLSRYRIERVVVTSRLPKTAFPHPCPEGERSLDKAIATLTALPGGILSRLRKVLSASGCLQDDGNDPSTKGFQGYAFRRLGCRHRLRCLYCLSLSPTWALLEENCRFPRLLMRFFASLPVPPLLIRFASPVGEQYHVVLFNLPLAAPPLSRAARAAEPYTFSYIARKLAAVMDEASSRRRPQMMVRPMLESIELRVIPAFPGFAHRSLGGGVVALFHFPFIPLLNYSIIFSGYSVILFSFTALFRYAIVSSCVPNPLVTPFSRHSIFQLSMSPHYPLSKYP